MSSIKLTLFFFMPLLAISLAQQKPNNTVRPSASDKVTAKSARSEYHHPHHGGGGGYEHYFPHHYGGHVGGHYKEFDHYLMPLLVVLGLGVLVMPLISVLMTTLVGNVPVTTLVSGRKRRDLSNEFGQITEDKVVELLKRFGKAYEAFNNQEK